MKSLRTFFSWAFVAAVALAMGSLSVSLMSPPARAASYFTSANNGRISIGANTTAVTDLLINPTIKTSGYYMRAAVNGTSNIAFGLDTDAPTYGRLTFNDDLTPGGGLGIAGKASDPNLYLNVPSGGTYQFRVNSSAVVTFSSAGGATFSGVVSVGGSTPASAAATGTAGTITWDSSYIYVCTATNTWKRAAIATW